MRQLHRRVENLEAKVAPAGFQTVHLVGVMPGETEEEACARYGSPISASDGVIFLVGPEPAQQEQVQ